VSAVTSRDGTRIAFERTGEGPPLIVVAGALSDRSAGAELASVLSPSLTVFAYDRRGRGESGDTAAYAPQREIEDIAALLEEAGGSAFVFGHSSGAALALEAAAHGLAIPKLALYEPPFIVDDSRPPLPEDYEEHLVELTSAGRRGDAVEYFMTTGPGVPPDVVAQMRGEPFWPAMEAMAHTMAYDAAILDGMMAGRPLRADRWASVTVPTLVVDGDQSPGWARNSVRALAEALPNAEHRTLQGQGHGAAPEALAPVLLGFFGVT
jgi:pimeloyl-ACP methyl ester carboxylesterase